MGFSCVCALIAAVALNACGPQKPAAAPGGATSATATDAQRTAPASGSSGTAAPASPEAMPTREARIVSNDGSYIVLFSTLPDPIPGNEPFAVKAKIYDARRNQQIVTDADVVVDAAMPEHRHGMNVAPRVRKLNDGSYVASGLVFHMPGRWELYFDITRKGETERAQAEIVID